MAYIAVQDLIARFGESEVRELSDRDRPSLGVVDEAVCLRAIADADALVDRSIGGRYAVPLATPLPVDVARIVADVARYYLHDAGAPEQVRRHYEDAVRWLEQVGRGMVDLIAPDGTTWPTRGADASSPASVMPYKGDAVFGDQFASAMDPSTVYAAGTVRGWLL